MTEIIIIGSGCGVPSLKRGSPGLVIRINDEFLLFDSGPGTLRKLLEAGITYQDINHIFYSHFHTDHIADLGPLLFAAKYQLNLREKSLAITGPPGIKNFYQRLLNLYGEVILPHFFTLNFTELTEGEISSSDWKLTAKPMIHTEHSIGYRLENSQGKVIVYSGDTDYCRNIITLAQNADILILECSFSDERKVSGHLTPSIAGKIASEAGCRKLVLTHLYPDCDNYDITGQCRKIFGREIVLAEDMMKIEV